MLSGMDISKLNGQIDPKNLLAKASAACAARLGTMRDLNQAWIFLLCRHSPNWTLRKDSFSPADSFGCPAASS